MSGRMRGAATGDVGRLFTFALIGLFALFALLLTLIGVGAYQSVIKTAALNGDLRASMSYIANKVRAGDAQGALAVGRFEAAPSEDGTYAAMDIAALVIDEDGEYQTCIYFYEGAIREWLMPVDGEFMPENGETLVAARALEIEMLPGGRVFISVTTQDGAQHALGVTLRSGAQGGRAGV